MPFADELINQSTAESLAQIVARAAGRDSLPAVHDAGARLAELSLRERADVLRDALLQEFPGSYAELAAAIRGSLADEEGFRGWMIWSAGSAVALKGANDRDFEDALAVLAEITGRLTSEFSIRPLLRYDTARALKIINHWTGSEDEHVRRLASEGTRAYLPWGLRVPGLGGSEASTISILDALYKDPSEYVRRSVANHLNDLSRDWPELVLETAGRWLAAPDASTTRLVKHALRTLIKKGNPGAFALLGFGGSDDAVTVAAPFLEATEIPSGGELAFSTVISNSGSKSARLVVDYVIHHQKANGQLTPKTFKLQQVTLGPGESISLARTHSFRPITTRRYHPGEHRIALQVNGVATDLVSFHLGATNA